MVAINLIKKQNLVNSQLTTRESLYERKHFLCHKYTQTRKTFSLLFHAPCSAHNRTLLNITKNQVIFIFFFSSNLRLLFTNIKRTLSLYILHQTYCYITSTPLPTIMCETLPVYLLYYGLIVVVKRSLCICGKSSKLMIHILSLFFSRKQEVLYSIPANLI